MTLQELWLHGAKERWQMKAESEKMYVIFGARI